jgi:hypothetical protein
MYVGGGLYLPTTGTTKPAEKKPATTTAVKKPTTNTLSTMAGSSLGTTSTKKPTTTTAAKKPTTNTLSSMAGSSLGTTSTKKPTTTKTTPSKPLAPVAGLRLPAAPIASMGASRSLTPSGGLDVALPYRPSVNIPLGNMAPGRDPAANYAIRPRVSANPVNQIGYAPVSGQPVAPLASGNVWSPELLEAMMTAPAGPKPKWQRSLDSLADMAYRGFMAPSRATTGYYDQFVIDPETGRVISMLDPRMIDDAAALAGFAQTGGIPLVGPRVAAAAIPRATAAAVIPRATAAGIDAALTPRQAQFRQLMDSLNADPANAAAAAPRPVSAGPRVTPGGGQPAPAISPAEIARLENILGNLGYTASRPAAVGSRLPDAANVLDEGFVSRAAAANDERLLANMMRENDAGALTSAINENDALVLRNAQRENDVLNTLNTRADGSDQFFFDVNPAMRYMDPDEAANIIRRPGAQTVYPPGFMSADEAANVLRPGPRITATDTGMDPVTKRMLIAAGGAGVAIPGLAGLSLLANGQFAPAPTATTPLPAAEPGGIDVAASGAPRSARALRQAQINQNAANLDPAIASQDQFNKWLVDNALANAPVESVAVDAEGAPVSVVGEDLGAYPSVNSPGQVELVGAEDVQPVDRPGITTSTDKARYDELFETGGTGDTPLAAGEEPAGAASNGPAAGTKFTPGPGQFVGSNGYIYEQSSDGSFERVGRVPGYTPAQLSEAANKGAFRDPNNIMTGGAKPKKQVKKKGEKNFIDKAGDILKERFDDSLFARLFLNQDDDAAAEEVAAGPEAVEYYSTPPASVPESLVSSSGSSKKRKPKDETDTGGTGTGGTGTGGTGTSPYTPEVQAMLNALYGNYMRQYNGPGVGYVPGVDPERNYFTPAFADGGLVDGRLVLGDGGPKEDKIPAMIDGVEQAKLSNGEFVMTAAAVKNAGDGDIELGAKRLMDLNNMLSYGKPADRLKVQHVK